MVYDILLILQNRVVQIRILRPVHLSHSCEASGPQEVIPFRCAACS